MGILKATWGVLVATKNVMKVMFIVWLWMPIVRAAESLWKASFGPCCENPDLKWSGGNGVYAARCGNCLATRTYSNNSPF